MIWVEIGPQIWGEISLHISGPKIAFSLPYLSFTPYGCTYVQYKKYINFDQLDTHVEHINNIRSVNQNYNTLVFLLPCACCAVYYSVGQAIFRAA